MTGACTYRFVVLEGASKQRFEELTLECVGKYTVPADKAEAAVERLKVKAAKTMPLVSHRCAATSARRAISAQ
jgi:hypothetical protein